MTGYPYSFTNASATARSSTGPGVPGTTGTLHPWASLRAETLSPKPSITSGVGPTNYNANDLLKSTSPEKHMWGEYLAHNHASFFNFAGEFCILRQESVARMDHVNTMRQRDLHNLINLKVGLNGREFSPCANLICLISL